MEHWSILLGIPTAVIAACTFIAKIVINKSFEAGLERHKQILDIEKSKLVLQFSSLHENQLEAIRDIHQQLIITHKKSIVCFNNFHRETGSDVLRHLIDEATTAFEEYDDRIELNEIYFDADLVAQLQNLRRNSLKILNNLLEFEVTIETVLNSDKQNETRTQKIREEDIPRMYLEFLDTLDKEYFTARFALVSRFREINGVSKPS